MSDLFVRFTSNLTFFCVFRLGRRFETWYKSSPYNDPVSLSFVFNAMLNLT